MIILQGVEIIALFVVMCFGVAQHQNGVADAMIEAAQKAGKIPPPGSSGEDSSATVQPFSPEQEAALHLSGIRVFLDTRSARRAPRQAAHCTQEAPSRLPTTHGMDQPSPASAGAGILPASACALTGPLQLLWRARERSLAQPLLPLGDGLYVHMAQPAGRQTA